MIARKRSCSVSRTVASSRRSQRSALAGTAKNTTETSARLEIADTAVQDVAFVVAAVLTPPDVLSQMSLAVPLLLLFEGSIWSVRIVERKKAREDAAKASGAKPDDAGPDDAAAKPAE